MPEDPFLERTTPEWHTSLQGLSTSDSSSRFYQHCIRLGCRYLRAYKGIVRVVAGLWNQHRVPSSSCFNEVMCSNIYHDLCAWNDLCVQLLLQLSQRLWKELVSQVRTKFKDTNLLSHQDSDPSWRFIILMASGKTAQALQDWVSQTSGRRLSQLQILFLRRGSSSLLMSLLPSTSRAGPKLAIASYHLPNPSSEW